MNSKKTHNNQIMPTRTASFGLCNAFGIVTQTKRHNAGGILGLEMNFYHKFYTANYLWLLHVENNNKYELGWYYATSAIFSVVFTLAIYFVSITTWAHEFGLIQDLPYGNISTNIVSLGVLFGVHYYVYVARGKYRTLVPVYKNRIKSKKWLLTNALLPLAIAFLMLFAFVIYTFIAW